MIYLDTLQNQLIESITLGITIIALLIAYFQLIIPLNKDRKQRKKLQEFFETTLVIQLWQNMNFIASIEKSYNNNLNIQDGSIRTPKFSPRTAVLEKLIDIQDLSNWNISDLNKQLVLEIYQQTIEVSNLFSVWKIDLSKYDNSITQENMNKYESDSVLMLEGVDVLMRNSMQLFYSLLKNKELIKLIPDDQIKDKLLNVSNKILAIHKKGKTIYTTYKSSYTEHGTYKPRYPYDVIICWEHDLKKCDKEIIELKNIISLHDSWKD